MKTITVKATMNDHKPKIILICGPTAIGKTAAAIGVAERLGGEIVGADSLQIYKYMDIGTAKPTPQERQRIPHHMIDIVTPDAPYDAARFSREGREAIGAIFQRGRIPVIAGGTGFYIKALVYGLFESAPSDPSIRRRLSEEAVRSGGERLFSRLKACDPEAAGAIHPNDTYRIMRALEVYEASGMTMTAFRRRHKFADAPYNVLKIGLFMDRQALYERIEGRVDAMIGQGLLGEVSGLLDAGYHEFLRPMQALGYRQMADFIKGRTDWESAVATLKRDTRHYAKRQLTWFRKDTEIQWFEPDHLAGIISHARVFLDA